jgi:hypothetical protein
VRIEGIAITDSPREQGWARLGATVIYGDGTAAPESVWVEVPAIHAGALRPTGDFLVAALAPLAATRHEHLNVAGPVDPGLRANLQEVTRVWRSWYPGLREVAIAVDSPAPAPEALRRRPAASFFSGGVDSFFTVLRHAAGDGTPSNVTIDDLILIHGFDIPLDNVDAFTTVRASLSRAADALGKRLVPVATNLRETRFREADWSGLSHGAALAGVAHALGNAYEAVLIGSSAGYRDLRFWGSHPLTDPMFTSSGTRIIHDGAAFMRVEKTACVARSPIARQHLRVCYKSRDGGNCGSCNNCYRTMLALDALGVLDECATFDRRSLQLARVERVFCRHDFDIRQFGYVLDLARQKGRADIVQAVEVALAGSERLRRRIRTLRALRDKPVFWRWAPAWERRMLRGWID